MNKKIIVILGLTATGKTDLAIKLAKVFNGEIMSADSRQIYREMNIGTAKPLKDKNNKLKPPKPFIVNGIPHYLIDIFCPQKEFNAAIFKTMAIKKIKEIQKKDKLPFIVGGTGLYIKAITENLSFLKIPAQKKLRTKLEKKTTEELFKIYKKLDTYGAKFIEKKNKRRLIRAIEVCKTTGKSFWLQRKKEKPLFEILKIGIKFKKEDLKKKIEKRVKKMIKSGLEKEVRNLAKKYGWKIPAMKTIGYQEWYSCMKNKQLPACSKKEIEEIKKEITTHTTQFSKRQITWFKRDKEINWVENYREAKRLVKKFIVA